MHDVWKLLLFGGDNVLFSFHFFNIFCEFSSISLGNECNGAKYGSLNLKLVFVPFNDEEATEPALLDFIFWTDNDGHMGGKINLALNNSYRNKIDFYSSLYYIIKIQSVWKGHKLRKNLLRKKTMNPKLNILFF